MGGDRYILIFTVICLHRIVIDTLAFNPGDIRFDKLFSVSPPSHDIRTTNPLTTVVTNTKDLFKPFNIPLNRLSKDGVSRIKIYPSSNINKFTQQIQVSCLPAAGRDMKDIFLIQLTRGFGEVLANIAQENAASLDTFLPGKVLDGSYKIYNYKVDSHISKDVSKSYLRLTIPSPTKDVSHYGPYVCDIHYLDENGQIKSSAVGAPITWKSRTCHGNIQYLRVRGKSNGGVSASNKAAAEDLKDLEKYHQCIDNIAEKYCIQASLLAAIASRESRGGRLLIKTKGYGDRGRGWGLMQCDIYSSGLPCKECAWNSCCHIEMMVGKKLVPYVKQVKAKHPTWTQNQALQGSVAAYNFGVKNVRTFSGLDIAKNSTNDYSNDVIARAQYFQRHGWN